MLSWLPAILIQVKHPTRIDMAALVRVEGCPVARGAAYSSLHPPDSMQLVASQFGIYVARLQNVSVGEVSTMQAIAVVGNKQLTLA